MKTVILAGGFGTRLSEYTESIPKPLVEIGGKAIIYHIMSCYYKYGFHEFVIALGYKGDKIKQYFLDFPTLNSDFTIDISTKHIEIHTRKSLPWKVTLVDTGPTTMTGGRLLRLRKYLEDDTFMMTYGDGLANINIKSLIAFHKRSSRTLTMTTVRPNARFGEVVMEKGRVVDFQEKPQLNDGWINGGFFVCNKDIFNYLEGDDEMFEREPIKRLLDANQIAGYPHEGFWKCMDNKRDKEYLEEITKERNKPWLIDEE